MKEEKPEEVVTIENVMKLMVQILKPTIDESNSTETTVSSTINVFEDGSRYKIKVQIDKL